MKVPIQLYFTIMIFNFAITGIRTKFIDDNISTCYFLIKNSFCSTNTFVDFIENQPFVIIETW